jgi:Flp pilus assembly protein TadG
VTRGSREQGGQALVELAIVLPVLLLLLIGIVDVSLLLNADITITNASREAASYAVLHPAAAPSAIASAATSRVAPLLPANVTVTAKYYNSATATFVAWPISGIPSSSPSPTEIPVQVEVSYPWSASTILIGALFGTGTRTVSGRSTMVATW